MSQKCICSNTISGKDPHLVCQNCIGLDHVRQALDNPGSLLHCAVFTAKSQSRWLVHQASLSGSDPHLPPTTPGIEEETSPLHSPWPPPAGVSRWTCLQCPKRVSFWSSTAGTTIRLFRISSVERRRRTLSCLWSGLQSPGHPLLCQLGMRVAHQSPIPSVWFCSICANAHQPGWTFLGQLQWRKHPGPAKEGRNCPWRGS